MKSLPTKASEKGRAVTAADFYEAGREELSLSLVAGVRNLSRAIEEPIANRPGLALAGFYRHFAWKRLQLIGTAERAYLDSLAPDVRRARFKALVDRKAFCFVFANGQRPGPVEAAFAETAGAVFLATPMKTRHFVHRSAFVFERLCAPSATIYGTMVEVCGLGVLFEGDPGLGKSETALGLVKRGHALVADDLTCVRREIGNSRIYASASDSTAGYMEIRGIGIMHVPSQIDRIGQTRRVRTILGVEVPNIIIPVSEGRDLVNLVETAALQHKLLQSGGDPVGALSERLRLRAEREEAPKETIVKRKGKR